MGIWNVRFMYQGKFDMVKQEMARISINILGISELKWTGMGEFNSDDHYIWDSVVAQIVKNPPAMCETWIWSLAWEDPLEDGMATRSSILCLENPHRQRSLVGYSPWGHNVLDTTEWLSTAQHYIYYCEQGSHRRNGVALIISKRVRNAVVVCNLKNDRMISIRLQENPFNITVIQLSMLKKLKWISSMKTYKTSQN